jgi:predicted permease
MVQDLAYALRNLRRHPLTGLVAVLTLGLGIGGATAVFSIVNAVVLRPLPFPEPDRLVRLYEVTPDGAPFSFGTRNYFDLLSQNRALARAAAFRETGTTTILDDGEPQRVVAVPVTASLPEVLQVFPVAGRFFTVEEDRAGAPERPIVLGHRLWRARFNADPAVLGRIVRMDDEAFTVVGVMPPGFDFPLGAEVWIPLRADQLHPPDGKDLAIVGRLATGVSLEGLRGELAAFGRAQSIAYPQTNHGWSAGAMPFDEWLVAPRVRDALWILFGAVGLLLLLACANVANLLVAHGAARQGEMRIRAALGAGRARLARQLFTESAVLSVLGTVSGVLVASWSVAAVHALGSGRVPRLDQARVDGTVLAFACLAGIVSCIVFGLAPALHAARVDLRAGMDAGVRHTGKSRRLRNGLVIAEVALALLLLVSAGLLANSFVRLIRTDSGFDARGVIAMTLDVPPARYPDGRMAVFHKVLLDRVRAIPGVSNAGLTSTDPFRQPGFRNSVTPEERAASAPPSGLVEAEWRSVTPGFLETLGVPLLEGRAFEASDRANGERVVLVNQALARQLWPDSSAVGRRIYWGGTAGRTRTVVGVIGDFRDEQLEAITGPMLFVPYEQVPVPGMTLLLRSSLDPGVLTRHLRGELRALDPALPAPAIHTVESSRAAAAAGPRFNTALLGAFAAIAFVLAITGVYAVLAFTAIERRRELAVRIALGASANEIVRLLVAGGLTLAGVGVAIGLAIATGLTRVLRSLLYDVTPHDPWTFAGASLVLLLAAAIACYLPARRAGGLDPVEVLGQ